MHLTVAAFSGECPIDRPFLYLVEDVRTGEVLFPARVVDPRTPSA